VSAETNLSVVCIADAIVPREALDDVKFLGSLVVGINLNTNGEGERSGWTLKESGDQGREARSRAYAKRDIIELARVDISLRSLGMLSQLYLASADQRHSKSVDA
jgi:hypothetical protein